jgi:hypothetical protein
MSHAIISGLRDPQGRAVVTLPLQVRQALMACDEALRAHGMQFEILCETCQAMTDDPNQSTVLSENRNSDGSLSGLVCRCTRRGFLTLA